MADEGRWAGRGPLWGCLSQCRVLWSPQRGMAFFSTGLPLPQHTSSDLIEGGVRLGMNRSLVLTHPSSLIPGLATSLGDTFGEFPLGCGDTPG